VGVVESQVYTGCIHGQLFEVWTEKQERCGYAGGNGISINTSQFHQIQCCTVLTLNLRLELDTELLLVLQCEYCTFKKFIG